MDVKINAKLNGRYLSDNSIRLELINEAYKKYLEIEQKKFEIEKDMIDEHTKFYLNGYGNDIQLINCLSEVMFRSRELLDSLLWMLNKITKGKTSKNFLKFSKALMNGEYDEFEIGILEVLKANISFIFHIRKIRNEIKNKPSNIKFRIVTDHLQCYFELPIKSDEKEFISKYIVFKNKEEGLNKGAYFCTLKLKQWFLDLMGFWDHIFRIIKNDSRI
ncbi:MAG: hypothetical protein HQL29_01970 [Candidatus Omnitrophica bacterium]|nr:hypothetical protein [Candidatus Omnitrophota bacterium]